MRVVTMGVSSETTAAAGSGEAEMATMPAAATPKLSINSRRELDLDSMAVDGFNPAKPLAAWGASMTRTTTALASFIMVAGDGGGIRWGRGYKQHELRSHVTLTNKGTYVVRNNEQHKKSWIRYNRLTYFSFLPFSLLFFFSFFFLLFL